RFPEERRTVLVRRPAPARHDHEVTFDREVYGAGERVRARYTVHSPLDDPAAGGAPAPVLPAAVGPGGIPPPGNGFTFAYHVHQRGRVIASGEVPVWFDRPAPVEFDLPQPLDGDPMLLTLELRDGGQ